MKKSWLLDLIDRVKADPDYLPEGDVRWIPVALFLLFEGNQ